MFGVGYKQAMIVYLQALLKKMIDSILLYVILLFINQKPKPKREVKEKSKTLQNK